MTPTGRTLKALRASGYVADVCERWLPHANVRRDLFGIGDVIAVRAGDPGPLLIQATTAPNLSARRRKAQAAPALRTWLASGGQFELWAWEKRGDSWTVRREGLDADSLAAVPVEHRPRRCRRRPARGLFDLTPAG